MKENTFINLYHTLRKSNPEEARRLVRKVLKSTNGNVSKTARILKIGRKTVRRARNGSLKDYSGTTPKNCVKLRIKVRDIELYSHNLTNLIRMSTNSI